MEVKTTIKRSIFPVLCTTIAAVPFVWAYALYSLADMAVMLDRPTTHISRSAPQEKVPELDSIVEAENHASGNNTVSKQKLPAEDSALYVERESRDNQPGDISQEIIKDFKEYLMQPDYENNHKIRGAGTALADLIIKRSDKISSYNMLDPSMIDQAWEEVRNSIDFRIENHDIKTKSDFKNSIETSFITLIPDQIMENINEGRPSKIELYSDISDIIDPEYTNDVTGKMFTEEVVSGVLREYILDMGNRMVNNEFDDVVGKYEFARMVDYAGFDLADPMETMIQMQFMDPGFDVEEIKDAVTNMNRYLSIVGERQRGITGILLSSDEYEELEMDADQIIYSDNPENFVKSVTRLQLMYPRIMELKDKFPDLDISEASIGRIEEAYSRIKDVEF